jgi:maleylpyruvate isomerase
MDDMTGDPRLHLELLREGTQRLIRTADGFRSDDWVAPSLLPEWSRAHVVAHLALNAEGLGAALAGLVSEGDGPPMYRSQEDRDRDIAELAETDREELRERLLAGCTLYADAFTRLPEDRRAEQIERVPGGATFPAGDSLVMRLREVEVHHADLGAGYSRADWSPAFCTVLLESMTHRDWPTSFTGAAEDTGDTIHYGGPGGPTVLGSAADLGWWLTGRGSGAELTSSQGELPEVPTW